MSVIIHDLPTSYPLPEQFIVYIRNSTASSSPTAGSVEKLLPTVNYFKNNPGCYIACYRHNFDSKQALTSGYSLIDDQIEAVGQIRIKGIYNRNSYLCEPLFQKNIDMSHSETYNKLCNQIFTNCNGDQCWAGGDTFGWYRKKSDYPARFY